MAHKQAVVKTIMNRANRFCNCLREKHLEEKSIVSAMRNNGYLKDIPRLSPKITREESSNSSYTTIIRLA